MENATKALLIAAAVLVAILLISLGIGVFNLGAEQMGNADLTEYEIQTVNGKFDKYFGTSVSGTDVNALLSALFNHNMSQEDAVTRVEVKLTKSNGITKKATYKTDAKPASPYAEVSTSYKYNVTAKYNTNTGLVQSVTIKGI